MTTRVTDDRAKFEAWATSKGMEISMCPEFHGEYDWAGVQGHWETWQAALRSQGKVERCPYCDDNGDVHSIDGEWRGRCDCKADISADRNWIAGAQWGFGRGLENDNASLAQAIEVRRRDIR